MVRRDKNQLNGFRWTEVDMAETTARYTRLSCSRYLQTWWGELDVLGLHDMEWCWAGMQG